jgi:hypothetical protein
VIGEIGNLKEVRPSAADELKCFITMDYQGNSYTGTLSFDDARFCRKISELLKRHRGESLNEIGSLKVWM